ncbi:MAG: outer membrane lipoprotein carrier protein LolA [Bacteroidota bacterium]
MKRIIIYIITILFTAQAHAQQDAQAKAILAQVSAKFRTMNTVKADFTFTLDNPQGGVKQTQNGTLIVNPKGNKFKVSLYDPANKTAVEQEIISDGKTQWSYVKANKEVEVNNAGKPGDELNPAQLFTLYEHGYKYIYTGDQKLNGKTCQVIDLSPEDANKNFFKIRLMIDKLKKQLYSATLFDKGGNKYTYTLNTITPNVKVTDDTFTFDKKAHPGVEVVDLR